MAGGLIVAKAPPVQVSLSEEQGLRALYLGLCCWPALGPDHEKAPACGGGRGWIDPGNGALNSIQVRHGQGGFGLAVDAFFEAGGGGAGTARMPEVTDQEEERQHELSGSEPLTDVDEVHRVGLGDDAAHGIEGSIRSVGHVFSGPAHLPGLNVVLELVEAQAVGATQGLQPGTAEVPEAHGFTTEDDLTGGGAHQVLAQARGAHGRTDVGAHALVTHQEGEALGLGGLGVGGAVELGGVGGVVEPDVARGNEAHEAQGAQAVAQVGLTVPDEGATHPAEGLGDHVPDATEDADQAKPDVATDDVLHRVHTDDPALTAEGGAGQIAKHHAGAEGWVGDEAHVAATWGPGVIDTSEEHGLEDQQQGTHAKKDQVIANDVGHLVFITPILREESGIVLQNLRTTQGVIETAQAENGRADQVQHPNHKEGVEAGDFTTGTDAVAEGGHVRKQDQTLFVHRLVKGEVAHLKQHHGAGPEDHQASVGHVGAKQAAGEVDQAGVARPPGVAGGVEVLAPDSH